MPVRPASPAEKARRDRVTHAAWGERLDIDAYAEREAGLRDHPFARAAMTTWLWTDDADEVLASCETFRMDSRCHGAPGYVFGVASVFVEPRCRRRGHATAMMRALVARLREETEAQAMILFSDVGAEIYERAGFVLRPSFETLLPAATTAEEANAQPAADPPATPRAPAEAGSSPPPRPAPPVRLLDEAGALAATGTLPDPGGRFVVLPTPAQVDWHLERERLYARLRDRSRPAAWGAVCQDALAIWCGDLKSERLDVLICEGGGAGRDAVLAAARRTAANAGLGAVVLWEGTTPRTGSLPMIAPLAEAVRPEDWTWIPRALWM